MAICSKITFRIAGTIAATANNENAYGLYALHALHGGNAATPLAILNGGRVEATASNNAFAIRAAGNGNASGLGYSVGGLAFGLETDVDGNTLLGLAGGYSHTYVALDERSDHGLIDSGQAVLYLHHGDEASYATGIAAYGYNSYDTRRQVTIGTINRTATAGYGGNEFSFYLEAGRNYNLRKVHLQPHAALQYIQLHQNGFLESGAQSVDLSFRGLLGSRLVSYLQTKSGRLLSLEGRALWRHEFLDEARVLDATFAGQPGGAFVVNGVNVDRDAAVLGAGLTFHLSAGWRLHANYDLLTNQNYTAHAGTGGLTFLWQRVVGDKKDNACKCSHPGSFFW